MMSNSIPSENSPSPKKDPKGKDDLNATLNTSANNGS